MVELYFSRCPVKGGTLRRESFREWGIYEKTERFANLIPEEKSSEMTECACTATIVINPESRNAYITCHSHDRSKGCRVNLEGPYTQKHIGMLKGMGATERRD